MHHLFRAKEMLASTLSTIHNERFVVRLVDRIRAAIAAGAFDDLREQSWGATTARASWTPKRKCAGKKVRVADAILSVSIRPRT